MKKDLGTFSKFHHESITKSDKDPNWNPPIREISVRKKGPSLKVTYQPFQIVKSCFLGLPVNTKLDILQNRRLSDIICDSTDIEVLPINIFDLQSETLPCKNRTTATSPNLGET